MNVGSQMEAKPIWELGDTPVSSLEAKQGSRCWRCARSWFRCMRLGCSSSRVQGIGFLKDHRRYEEWTDQKCLGLHDECQGEKSERSPLWALGAKINQCNLWNPRAMGPSQGPCPFLMGGRPRQNHNLKQIICPTLKSVVSYLFLCFVPREQGSKAHATKQPACTSPSYW
jgi:hypothetical protein